MLDALWKPGAEHYVGHKVDFEDLDGLRWFIARGADMNERCCLHHAIARGRSVRFIEADPRRGRRRRSAVDVLGRRPAAARPRGALRAPRGVRAARVARRDGRARRGRRGRPRRGTRRVRRAPARPAACARQPGDRRLRLDPRAVRAPRPDGDRRGRSLDAGMRRRHARLEQLHAARPGRDARPPGDGRAADRAGRRPRRPGLGRPRPDTARLRDLGAPQQPRRTTATTSARSRRSPRRARRPSTSRRAPTRPSTGCWSDYGVW